ncbi:MAG TPA: hypothetical protein VN841_10155 [Bryobacteraceae bacterium]|nr:hypothetical protein [Bryobacteraceae bacterium]
MSISGVSSSQSASATQAAQQQAAQKAALQAAQQKSDTVQLSATAQKALQGGDADHDGDSK